MAQQPYQQRHRGYVLQESHASEPIRRGRHERWISLERWWSTPKVTFTSKSVRFSAAHRPALLLAGKAPTRPSTVFPLKTRIPPEHLRAGHPSRRHGKFGVAERAHPIA